MKTSLPAFLGEALRSLTSHPLRSAMTALTVTFGAAVLMVLVSYGTGVPQATVEVLRQLGSTQIKIEPARTWGPRATNKGRKIRIRYTDLDAIREASPSVGMMAAGTSPRMGGPTFSSSRSWPWASLKGVGSEYLEVADLQLVEGRWFTEQDEKDRLRVAVLNLPLAEGLFRGSSPVGQWLESEGRRFDVVGVIYDPEAFAYSFYVPYSAAMGLGDSGGKYVEWLSIKPSRPDLTRTAIGEVRSALGNLYSFDPEDETIVQVEEQSGFIEQVNSVARSLEWLVLTIALVALALGSLGAANVVGITVTERRAEIGLRKALGATAGAIRAQVLAESLMLCLFGGLAGVGLGLLAVGWFGPLQLGEAIQLNPRSDLLVFASGLGVLVLVGTVAGMPASNRAARLDPSVTLHDV